MKPASALLITRSVADGDPVLLTLVTKTEAGIASLADNATVKLRVDSGAGVIVIPATGQGGGSGNWACPANTLPAGPGRFGFSIEVTAGGYTYTHGKGFIEIGVKV